MRIKLNRKNKKKNENTIFTKKSEWKVIVQVVFELNSLMAVGMNDLQH